MSIHLVILRTKLGGKRGKRQTECLTGFEWSLIDWKSRAESFGLLFLTETALSSKAGKIEFAPKCKFKGNLQ